MIIISVAITNFDIPHFSNSISTLTPVFFFCLSVYLYNFEVNMVVSKLRSVDYMYITIFRLLQRILDKFQFLLATTEKNVLFKKSIGFETKTTT